MFYLKGHWQKNFNSSSLIFSNIRELFERNLRIPTKAFIIFMLICIATSLRNTAESIAIPCSVNTYGKYLRPPFRSFSIEVAICDLSVITSILQAFHYINSINRQFYASFLLILYNSILQNTKTR